MYCERARWESFRLVLVVEAGCVDRVSLQSETKGANVPLIIYDPFTNSRLKFDDAFLVDLKLETEVEEFDERAEMLVIAHFGKATSKDGGGDE